MGYGNKRIKKSDFRITKERLGGFSSEQISSDKNPTVKESLQVEVIQLNYTGTLIHKGFNENDLKQKMVAYAYKLGGLDFVKLIECENGNRNIHAVGDGGKAFGLCQINTNYHKLPDGYKDSWQIQVETCYKKFKDGTKFYGPSRIVKGVKCSQYVENRFILK